MGVLRKSPFRGGGKDIFWNYTYTMCFLSSVEAALLWTVADKLYTYVLRFIVSEVKKALKLFSQIQGDSKSCL